MKRISEVIGKYMAWIVLIIAALALFAPGTCLWIRTGWINYLLMIVQLSVDDRYVRHGTDDEAV